MLGPVLLLRCIYEGNYRTSEIRVKDMSRVGGQRRCKINTNRLNANGDAPAPDG